MSERKDKRKFNQSQPYSYNTIYQSRIVSSYPFCSLARSKINQVISPNKTKEQTLINLKKQLPIQYLKQSRKPSVDYKRPKSLDFQNNLFLKLATKIQKQREVQGKRNQEVLNEYYDTVNKQNKNTFNHNRNQKQLLRKPSIQSQISIKLGNSRYQHHQPLPSKQRIKFNKLKQKSIKKKSEQQMDFVRTSDAQFKITKTSLDMKPVF